MPFLLRLPVLSAHPLDRAERRLDSRDVDIYIWRGVSLWLAAHTLGLYRNWMGTGSLWIGGGGDRTPLVG